ncbi:hypothetical protein AS034_02020 [[Bacillus] enclensis]|nr:hypothetical protein AS034_02020 [[Bacillus] enclensis]
MTRGSYRRLPISYRIVNFLKQSTRTYWMRLDWILPFIQKIKEILNLGRRSSGLMGNEDAAALYNSKGVKVDEMP